MKQHLIYAMKDGEIMSIEDVERGLKCGCTCAACGERLIAKKGSKMTHHFSHPSGSNCAYGYESSLHLMAKEILSKAGKMIIPDAYFQIGCLSKQFYFVKEQEIIIDHVELEKRVGNIIPDIVVYANGKPFFVEIYVTHAIDEKKLKKLKEIGISTIEIDLSEFNALDEDIKESQLKEILLGKSSLKQWVYHALRDKYLDWLYEAADKRYYTIRKYGRYEDRRIYGCPHAKLYFCGEPYAAAVESCMECDYRVFLKDDYEDFVPCVGRLAISCLEDLEAVQGTDDAVGKIFPAIDEAELIKAEHLAKEKKRLEKLREAEELKRWEDELERKRIQEARERPLDAADMMRNSRIFQALNDYCFDYEIPLFELFENLTGRKGNVNAQNGTVYNYDTFLRCMTKELLDRNERFKFELPAFPAHVSFTDNNKPPVKRVFPTPALLPTDVISPVEDIFKAGISMTIKKAELIAAFSNDILNLILHFDNKFAYLDLFADESMSETQIEMLKSRNISIIRMDLSKLRKSITIKTLLSALTDAEYKSWSYCSVSETKAANAKKLQVDVTGWIKGCPDPSKSWVGAFGDARYCNFDRCKTCSYCAAFGKDFVLCLGYTMQFYYHSVSLK